MRVVWLLLTLSALLFATEGTAEQLGYYSDYAMALSVAKKEKKPLMLVVVTSYCPWCRKFERKSLAAPNIADKVHSGFVAVIVDRNKDAATFPKQFQTPRIPSVFFVDPKSAKAYWETVGYLNKKEFSEALDDARALFYKQPEQTQ